MDTILETRVVSRFGEFGDAWEAGEQLRVEKAWKGFVSDLAGARRILAGARRIPGARGEEFMYRHRL